MNSLTLYILNNELDHDATMNRLMDAGLISDNSVTSEEVSGKECFACCVWLQKNPVKV